MRAPTFLQPISSDIRRRGVVVRASSDARLRASSAITTFFAIACSMVVNEAMSLVQDGVLGAEELEAIFVPPILSAQPADLAATSIVFIVQHHSLCTV